MHWDPRRACFWLVASVIGLHGMIVLMHLGACLYYAEHIVEGKWTCDAKDKLTDLLAATLAAALGFAGGFTTKKD